MDEVEIENVEVQEVVEVKEPLEFVTIGDSVYPVIKTGRLQAEQVAGLAGWVGVHGNKAMRAAQKNQTDPGNGLTLILSIIENLDADALVKLFQVMTGCTFEEANLYFDVSVLVDVAIENWERQPAVRKLVNRFFS